MTWFRFLHVLLGAHFASLLASAAPPEWTALYPAGGKQGTTVTATAAGTFSAWPVRVWSSAPGIEVTLLKDKGKLQLKIAADVPPGTHWLRLASPEGASSLRPFVVGSLPEAVEQEPNDDPAKPQQLENASVVVNGVLGKARDVDTFAVRLAKGQRLVASLLASEVLGSPMDAVLQALSGDGFVLEQDHDTHGLDPQVVLEAPADGTYLVRVFAFPSQPNSSIGFAGGDSFVYRLTLTTGGFADHTYPLAVSRSAPAEAALGGWNIPRDAGKLPVAIPAVGDRVTLSSPGAAGTGVVGLVSHAALVEAPENDLEHPQEIAVPATVSGRISAPGDVDAYAIRAARGRKVQIRVHADPAGSPVDPVLRVLDEKGATLTRMDDVTRAVPDVDVTFTPPADGRYLLVIEDLFGKGDARHVYRLDVLEAGSEARLGLTTDRFTLVAGKPLDIPVKVDRVGGFAGEIEIVAEGLPAGASASPVKSLATGATAKGVTLQVSGGADVAGGPFRILARVRDRAGQVTTQEVRAPQPRTREGTSLLWLSPPSKPKK